VRVFAAAGQTSVIVMSELPQNRSTSVTNMAEYLASERIQHHVPQRLAALPPPVVLEHSVDERTPGGRLGRKATWDRLSVTPGRRGGSGAPDRNGSRLGTPIGSICRSMRWKRCLAGRRCRRCRHSFR
jgi:hypothetical protein